MADAAEELEPHRLEPLASHVGYCRPIDLWTILASGGLGAFVGGTIKDLLTRRWQLKEERRTLHRTELRQAYADFIATFTQHLDAGTAMIAAANRAVRNRAVRAAESDDAFLKAIQDFLTAQNNADAKAMNVALLAARPDRG